MPCIPVRHTVQKYPLKKTHTHTQKQKTVYSCPLKEDEGKKKEKNPHASKVMLKILQARLQQYVNCELSDVQAGFTKVRRTRDQIANICWIIEKAQEFRKNIYFCFMDYTKAFDCVNHNKL